MTLLVWLPSRRTVCALSRRAAALQTLRRRSRRKAATCTAPAVSATPAGQRTASRPTATRIRIWAAKGKVAVVHNGSIENYKELRERLEAHGYEFKSETDTETVAHLVDYLHTGKQEDLAKTVLQAVQRLRGSYALGVVSMDNTQEIVAARRGNPLVIGIGEGENMIASDITAIINRTKRYIILDDNEVAIVRPDSVVVMNEFGDTVEKEIMTVTWDMSAAEKGGYQHFMLKEIMEQPKAVADTVKPRIKNDAVVFEDNGLTDERLREIEHIHIIGCGSALHAGMVGKRVIEAMCRIRCTAEVASEFRYENPIIGKKDMCIVISQSGETADTLWLPCVWPSRQVRSRLRS